METKLCRICGKLGQNYVNIFKTEGLKNKIETCLPIVISPYSLLPDTICGECMENVDNFYSFTKNCLQTIIVLEAQYDITESCLKTKRKFDKSTTTELLIKKNDNYCQTDDYLDVFLRNHEEYQHLPNFNSNIYRLVDYDIDTDDNDDDDLDIESSSLSLYNNHNKNNQIDNNYFINKNHTKTLLLKRRYFDDGENNIIDEIVQRKRKRKMDGEIERCQPKIYKPDQNPNKRKCRQPKKMEYSSSNPVSPIPQQNHLIESATLVDSSTLLQQQNKIELINENLSSNNYTNCTTTTTSSSLLINEEIGTTMPPLHISTNTEQTLPLQLPQICLLCEEHFSGPSTLASHIFETHGIDMTEVINTTIKSISDQTAVVNINNSHSDLCEKKKKLPNLLKISDLKKNDPAESMQMKTEQLLEDTPPKLTPSFVCSLCPAIYTVKTDLYNHFQNEHREKSEFLCATCLFQGNSLVNLQTHLEICIVQHPPKTRFYCQICLYGDDSSRNLENHILVHNFLLDTCRKHTKMFDPADYIILNEQYQFGNTSPNSKNLICNECGLDEFISFKEFSNHRRNLHSIFHCDLCNKFYGRNSHLWKHVNRLHKGHPSITCQICYKTSASKYHLSQHFNKIHNSKQQFPVGAAAAAAGGGGGNMPQSTRQKLTNHTTGNILSNDSLSASLAQFLENDDFMSQKFQGFDFQSVKQSFLRQELLEQKQQMNIIKTELLDDNNTTNNSDQEQNDYQTNYNNLSTNTTTTVIKNEPLIAPKEIDSSSDLYTNIITNYTPPTNEGEYKCPKCGKGFHKRNLLKKHRKNCRPRLQKDLLTRCKSCARIFKDRQSLAKHLVNYHSEYSCEICNQTVQSKCEIVSHIRFSHPGCHLVCKMCSNILRSQKDLQIHLRDHTNSYVCQFCGDSLESKIKLKMHILSLHRKILSLSCGICLKLFESQHILRDHVKLIHRNQLTPLTSCPVCGKNYGSKWKTYDHLNKSHGRIFKACKVCLEVFDNEVQLQQHSDLNHPNIVGTQSQKLPVIPQMNHIPPTTTITTTQNVMLQNYKNEPQSDENDDQSDNDDSLSHDNIIENHFNQLPPDYNQKVSLLEKRLLGTNTNLIINDNEKKINIKQKNIKKNNRTGGGGDNDDELSNNQTTNHHHHSSNSSKRTVYVNSNDPSFCEICLKTWPAKKHLWQHYIRCHKSVAATVCGICLKTNNSYKTLQIHLRENHPTLLHGQGFGSNFICRICGRYHNASSKLKLHMAIHENFDWDLLENKPETCNNQVKIESTKNSNGCFEENDEDDEDEQPENDTNNINYESLIEQVECSSESESEEEEEEEEEDGDNDDDDEEEEEDTQSNKNDDNNENVEETDDDEESSSDDEEDENQSAISENSQDIPSAEQNDNEESTESSSTCFSIKSDNYNSKTEELNSAIQSIEYDGNCGGDVNENDEFIPSQVDIDDDEMKLNYCDIGDEESLNENEIESAVGSIL